MATSSRLGLTSDQFIMFEHAYWTFGAVVAVVGVVVAIYGVSDRYQKASFLSTGDCGR